MTFLSMRRFSKSSSIRNPQSPQSPPVSFSPLAGPDSSQYQSFPTNHAHPSSATTAPTAMNGTHHAMPGTAHTADSRPISQATSSSFDFANRPISQPLSHASAINGAGLGLSRTDLIVLKHFWEAKIEENRGVRDLHYLKFPFFPQYPSHKDLLPYCEIYHLIKTSPGAKIISLGSTNGVNGVYIGFELFEGSQLHIDMDDEWTGITHYRVTMKPFDKMVADGGDTIKALPKPLTIEFLEEQYARWMGDLMSICWEGREVRELGSVANPSSGQHLGVGSAGSTAGSSNLVGGLGGQHGALKRGGTIAGTRGGGVEKEI